jgi:hypothetical protein
VDIDDRLDRLVERHEALSQSLELIAAMQRDGERQFKEERAQTEQLFGQVALRLREATDNIREMSDSINRLARIAGVHQDRLDGHEQRLKDVEGPRT